jgi:hypothetical protein
VVVVTFKELQDRVLANAFDETERDAVKVAINHRLQQMWDAEAWSFKFSSVACTVVNGNDELQGAPVFATVDSVFNPDGDALIAITDPREFYLNYVSSSSQESGDPEAFTVLGGRILLGPVPDADATGYQLLYELPLTLLVGDADVPSVPDGYHLALANGAKAQMFADRNIPGFAQQFEGLWASALETMRNGPYLETVRDPGDVWSGRYIPELF